jgi:hypothetical protein
MVASRAARTARPAGRRPPWPRVPARRVAPAGKSLRPYGRHYTANRAPGKASAGKILRAGAAALVVWCAAGCAAGGAFRSFEGQVSWYAKGGGNAWLPVSRADVRGVVGPEYVRFESVRGAEVAGGIYSFARAEYWEYTRDADGRWSVRMCPVEERIARLEENARVARGYARSALASRSALARQSLWPLFSGEGGVVESLADREEIHGAPARKVRAGVYPGVVWDLWLSAEFPLSPAQAELLLVALDVPRSRAREAVARLGEPPVEIDALAADGRRRVKYAFRRAPAAVAAEDVTDVIPPEWVARMAARERTYDDDRLLFKCIMTGAGGQDGVSALGACVRACRTLTARKVQYIMRRMGSVDDPSARRYLMAAVMAAKPDHAAAPLAAIVEGETLEVAVDAAAALAARVPAPDNVRVLGTVLRRCLREGRAAEFGLEVDACLRTATGTDVGYWPGPDGERALERWLDVVRVAAASR